MVPMTRLALLLLCALLAACSAPAVESPSESPRTSSSPASPSPAAPASDGAGLHGQIAYVAGLDPQIHLLDVATGESRQLTELRPEHAELTAAGPMRPALTCGFGAWSLTWSPDGRHLAFSYGSCDSVVYVVDLEGTLRRIGDGAAPAWSPDGTRLLHAANVPYSPCGPGCGTEPPEPTAWALRIIDLADDGESRPFTADGSTSGAGSPTWSPDGSTIAYSAPPPAGGGGEGVFTATYLVDAAGGAPRFLGSGIWPLRWLSDGRLLVTSESDSTVLAIDLDTGGSSVVAPPQTSMVSPDGSRIVAWVVDALSGEQTSQLLDEEGEVLAHIRGDAVAWSPDSSALAALDRVTSSLLILGRDGAILATHPVELEGGGGNGSWRPGS